MKQVKFLFSRALQQLEIFIRPLIFSSNEQNTKYTAGHGPEKLQLYFTSD